MVTDLVTSDINTESLALPIPRRGAWQILLTAIGGSDPATSVNMYWLWRVRGMSHANIARIYGVSRIAVTKRLTVLRRQLSKATLSESQFIELITELPADHSIISIDAA